MDPLIQLINGVGFPIAACVAMGWYIVWTRKNNIIVHDNRDKNMKDNLKIMADALENNTDVLKDVRDIMIQIKAISERGENNGSTNT